MMWGFVYAWAGWLWGGTIGWPRLGGIGGFVAGAVVGSAMSSRFAKFEVTFLAPLLAFAAWLIVPRPWLPHAATAICMLPLVSYVYFAACDALREKRARRVVAETGTLEAVVPLLVSEEIEVRVAARAHLGRMNLPPDERARAILEVAERLGEQNLVGEPQWLTALVTPLARAEPVPREALLLLYERLGWVSAGRWSPEENCDRWIQDILFDRLQWNDDGPLRRASQARIAKGWNVDRMVTRLLETDPEEGARMAQEAFPAGALSAAALLHIGDARAASVIDGEIARAMTSTIERYDRIVEAALGIAPARSLAMLERVLDWDPADYCIEGIIEKGLLKDADLGERCRRAPVEAARFSAAVRSHIARLERYDWNTKFSPGWHPAARLKMWSELAGALDTHLAGTPPA